MTIANSLPSGVTDMGTTSSDNITFTSILQCNIGKYTCRIGPAHLINSSMVSMNDIAVTCYST